MGDTFAGVDEHSHRRNINKGREVADNIELLGLAKAPAYGVAGVVEGLEVATVAGTVETSPRDAAMQSSQSRFKVKSSPPETSAINGRFHLSEKGPGGEELSFPNETAEDGLEIGVVVLFSRQRTHNRRRSHRRP